MSRQAAEISAADTGTGFRSRPRTTRSAGSGETLNEMLDRLETALEHERRFVADASHELRTPLGMLRTELELALRRERSAEELRAALVSASEETDRLARLAEDLLVLARADRGRLPLRVRQLEVGKLLEDVRRRYAAQAVELGRELVVEPVDGVEIDVTTDPARAGPRQPRRQCPSPRTRPDRARSDGPKRRSRAPCAGPGGPACPRTSRREHLNGSRARTTPARGAGSGSGWQSSG